MNRERIAECAQQARGKHRIRSKKIQREWGLEGRGLFGGMREKKSCKFVLFYLILLGLLNFK